MNFIPIAELMSGAPVGAPDVTVAESSVMVKDSASPALVTASDRSEFLRLPHHHLRGLPFTRNVIFRRDWRVGTEGTLGGDWRDDERQGNDGARDGCNDHTGTPHGGVCRILDFDMECFTVPGFARRTIPH